MRLAWFLARKFMREYRAQTALTMAAVGVGVAVMVFLSALINGLQKDLISRTLGTQPHIVVQHPDASARPLRSKATIARVELPSQRLRSIAQWQQVERQVLSANDVLATAPCAVGEAFATHGLANRPVTLIGADIERLDAIIPIASKLVRGDYRINGGEAIVGVELARTLGADVGDKFRVSTAQGHQSLLTIRGLIDMGNTQVNQRWVLLPLRTGQMLIGLPGGANRLYVNVDRIFNAEHTASRIAADTGLVADSWMATNEQLLVALRSQRSSSYTIQLFVFLAVAMGIASVLAVSVVQRTREIGILRAMGTPRRRIVTVFLMQGGSVGLAGSMFGCGLGLALAKLFQQLMSMSDDTMPFHFALTPSLFAIATVAATATGIVAAALPARRAGALKPVEAIRHV